jgi:hypothetical protein
MNVECLLEVASQAGVPACQDLTSEKRLVRAIQKQRGEEPCYLTDKRYACKERCVWQASCQKLRAVWLR